MAGASSSTQGSDEVEELPRTNVFDLFRIDGKTAIVTGGGRGLGEYMAEALAEAGANVVLCSRKVEACQEVADEIRELGVGALAMRCDVTEEDDIEEVVSTTIEEFGGVDILINNSGTSWGAPAEEMPADKVDKVLAVNVRGTFLMAKAVGNHMIDRGEGGAMINIASVAAFKGGRPGRMQAAGYNASKGAVVSLTRDLAGSWAQYGIRVNAIAPGWFPTKMSRGLISMIEDELLAGIPLKRFGNPDDLKGVALLLASPAGAYMTGQTVVVDGGQLVW
ncbi:MAG: SDR family oxidoreductase [Longimicrobiales bacterium]|nr:SDR family oxidoreductase [Longimicrobiales bacterium]